jgi:hypothetical protein
LGGALFLSTFSSATFVDDITFTDNSAAQGGAMYVFLSSVFVAGSLCATSNTADRQAGLAGVFQSLLEFSEGSDVNSNGNTPDTVVLIPPAFQPDNTVRCGTGPSWASGIMQDVFASFNITGQMCACNDEFVTSNLTMQSCDSCGGRGFDTERCACVSVTFKVGWLASHHVQRPASACVCSAWLIGRCWHNRLYHIGMLSYKQQYHAIAHAWCAAHPAALLPNTSV